MSELPTLRADLCQATLIVGTFIAPRFQARVAGSVGEAPIGSGLAELAKARARGDYSRTCHDEECAMAGALIALALALASAAGPDSPSQADLAAANAWVSLVDAMRWQESWDNAGSIFKAQTSPERWTRLIQPVRTPLGAVSSRSLKSITKAASLPGAPDGEYEIVQFQTTFTRKKDATETVVLAREASGWRVDGYFIR